MQVSLAFMAQKKDDNLLPSFFVCHTHLYGTQKGIFIMYFMHLSDSEQARMVDEYKLFVSYPIS